MFNLTAKTLNTIYEATKANPMKGELSIVLPYLTSDEKETVDNLMARLRVEGFIVASVFPATDTIEIIL